MTTNFNLYIIFIIEIKSVGDIFEFEKSLSIIVLAVLVVGVLAFQFINHTGPFKNNGSQSSNSTNIKDKEKVHVDRVVDGDTFVATNSEGKEIKVRLIGIDTPETVKPNTPVQPYGKEDLIIVNNT